ncbi:MAG: GNAT family N-acetyltransferase [candidate division Zixibacteria bacterium]|nr:GNAT family N-acetyltransferase [candidate division Zixibacteria bacterium]
MLKEFDKKYRVVTTVDKPELLEIADEVVLLSWPEFMLNDSVANKYWNRLYEEFPEYQFCLMDNENDTAIAAGNCIPLYYDGNPDDLPEDGWDWVLQKGFDDRLVETTPNIMSALSITIHPAYRDKGLSREMIRIMKQIGHLNNLKSLIAPVRPFLKSTYPLIPIDKYILWRDENDLPFDAWIRVHHRDGGKIIKSCPQSMRITGTVSQWEEWTGQKFPESGLYTVYGALVPITIDCEADLGEYIEPNVWIYHSID